MMNKNIAFIVTSYWAYGELLIALQFAKYVMHFGYSPYFFIPPSHEKILKIEKISYTILIPKCGRINAVLFKDYENKYKPQSVILSDFLNYNFCEKHYGLTVEDLKIFSGRLGTFDNFDWNYQKRKMDTYGFHSSIASKININDYGFRLIPCPIGNPMNEQKKDNYYYPLMNEYMDYKDEKKNYYRNLLNLPKDKSIIMVTKATWQETYKTYLGVSEFIEFSNEIYTYLLAQIAQNSLILYVGGDKKEFEKYNVDHIVFLKNIPPSTLDYYILASDLFISRNATSTTLAKVATAGMPTLLIMNSYTETEMKEKMFDFELEEYIEEKLLKINKLYKYYMFPVGWYQFLQPIFKNNPYLKLLNQQEMLNTKSILEKVYLLLNNKSLREQCKRDAINYRNSLNKLDRPEVILEKILYETTGDKDYENSSTPNGYFS